MNRLPLLFALSVSLPLAGQQVGSQAKFELALGGHDPVALARGDEIAGDKGRTIDHGRFRYRFANDANRAAFAADPARHAIQLGGGCGAMGPLSGVGDPKRWTVHDGRIYIFASDQCRAGFLKDPAACIDADDAMPAGTAEAVATGRAWIDKAVEAIGGAKKVDGLESVALLRDGIAEYDGKRYRTGSALLFRRGALRRETWFGDWKRIDVVAGETGFVHERDQDGANTWDHAGSQSLAVTRNWERSPLAILRARGREDFVAIHIGSDKVGEHEVELVATGFGGTATTLLIDRRDHRVRGVRYHGRAGSGRRGDVVAAFDDFMDVRGLTLPMTWRLTVDGKERQPISWTSIAVDQELDAELFARASVGKERSAKPGINASFKADNLNVGRYVKRFEGESREVFVHRHRITKAMQIEKGQAIGDIGAGTGLFLQLFADAVGAEGKVYAVDIAPKFIDLINERKEQKKLAQVEAVLCTDRSVELPDASIDVAFICDVYHHFEYPLDSMRSIHAALRSGGRLFVVDFDRIPGKSRPFIINHVRAGKEVFRTEIEEAGFELVRELEVRGLRENYVLEFKRK